MRYEWDEAKDRLNQRRHDGISFGLAVRAFIDRRCLVYPDRIDDNTGEERWHAVGMVNGPRVAALLLVVHAYREDAYGEEIIRIISARAAEKREVRRYQQQAVD
jgi:uncharacterized DUF497 family protein